MRGVIGAFLLIGILSAPLSAQTNGPLSFSLGPQIGVYVPVQDQADDLSEALALGGIVRTDINEWIGVVGSFWWAPSEAEVPSISLTEEDIDLFQYDLGIEVRPFANRDDHWFIQPFIGAGAGGRSYSFRDLDADAETDFAGFGSIGGEIAFQRLALRLEARGYLSDYDGLTGAHPDSEGRGEFTFTTGLMYRF
jgi:hypothetical protein